MRSETGKARLQTAAIIVGYAMSRIDARFLMAMDVKSWTTAFQRAGKVLGVPPSSIKNLRDEFDPFHRNARKGWRNRPLRPNRQRVLSDFFDVSDDALLETVGRILHGDKSATTEIVDSIRQIKRPSYNVAERLLTGRLAEDYFMNSCEKIIGVRKEDLLDRRYSALGFDFGLHCNPDRVIEVKGVKARVWADPIHRSRMGGSEVAPDQLLVGSCWQSGDAPLRASLARSPREATDSNLVNVVNNEV